MTAELPLAFVGGLVVACLTTPVGVSGAIFLLPFQVTVLSVPSPAVTSTNLLYNVISVPGALARYRRGGTLLTSLTRHLLLGTIPGVVVGAMVRVFLLPDGAVFQVLLGLLLIPVGVSLLWRLRRAGPAPADRDPATRGPSPEVVAAFGLAAGVIGGIYGIGGGSLVAPFLVLLGASPRLVAPAALTTTFVTSCVAVGVYSVLAWLGEPQAGPEWVVALFLGAGGLLGGYLGAALQSRLPTRVLTGGLGLVSLTIAMFYLWTALGR